MTDPGSMGRDVLIGGSVVAILEAFKKIPLLKRIPRSIFPVLAFGIGGGIGIFAYPERSPVMGFLSGGRDGILGVGGRSAIKNVVVNPIKNKIAGGGE